VSPRNLPVGMFGAVMGLTGLGLAARSAAPLFPGVFRAPAYFTEPWIALGLIAFAFLLPAYLLKLIRFPAQVRAEFASQAQFGFFGTLPVGMFLVSGGLAPYAHVAAEIIWWAGAVLLVLLQVTAISRWLSGAVELAQVNGGWLIAVVGGIVAPAGGIPLGLMEPTRFVFGVSAIAALPLAALLAYRAVLGPPMAQPLPPSWFILLVPPSLIFAFGAALYPAADFLQTLYHFDVVLAAALLVYARGFFRWPFAVSWWAFTFPLDAFAFAAVRYAQLNAEPVWRAIAAAALLLATLAVIVVLARTLRSAASRQG
jgi:tellurite resistance protein